MANQCPVCGAPARRATCGRVQCRQAHRKAARRARDLAVVQRERDRRQARVTRPDRSYRLALSCLPAPPESSERVEQLYQAARAARLQRERETGQRTFTVGDGWQQRPGAGARNFNADEQGGGFG